MLIKKREDVTKQGFCKILWRKLRPRGTLLLEFIHSSGWGGGERLFEFDWEEEGVGAYSRWALIRGWALIRINTLFKPNVCIFFLGFSCCPYYRGVCYSEVSARREYFSPNFLICSFFYSEHRRFGTTLSPGIFPQTMGCLREKPWGRGWIRNPLGNWVISIFSG